MPKRSKEDTLVTINTILDEATNQLLNLGYDEMSYTTLSKATGVSRTGISHHFPKKTDFTQALKGRFLQMFMTHLNVSAKEEDFIKSWNDAMLTKEFSSICHLIIHQVTNDNASEFASSIIEQIKGIAAEIFGESGSRTVEWLFGKSMASIALSTAQEKAA